MAKPPHFSMLRAAFWLLAIVICTELTMTLLAGTGCFWLILTGQYKIGACENVSAQIREIWAEVLAAILALLLASRGNGNGKPPPPPPPTE
jgi:hypothetical protein